MIFKYNKYFVVHSWMVKCFGLKGLDLMVYAIIYGLCQYGDNHTYSANNSFLVELTGATRNGIQKSLQKLVKNGFLIRSERKHKGLIFVSFKINEDKINFDVNVQKFISSIKAYF